MTRDGSIVMRYGGIFPGEFRPRADSFISEAMKRARAESRAAARKACAKRLLARAKRAEADYNRISATLAEIRREKEAGR
jgi:hypothetical protein